MDIAKIAVIGSGVMGSGIAAHAANAGIPTVLLDIVPPEATNRNMLTENAVKRQLAAGGFLSPARADLITCGNLEDHLHLLSDADWIIEAVLEKPEVKQDVYRKIERVRKSGSVIASNTSTLKLEDLTRGMPAHFTHDFMVTHFFNPPRHMRLLEVVKSPSMRRDAYETICSFADIALGKEVVECKDTPGFIANRIGVYWMIAGLNAALASGIALEEADAAMKPMGIPGTGIFGLFDLIGLDLMPHITRALDQTLPLNDAFRAFESEPALLGKLIADGYTGRKGKGGFYRLRKEGDQKIKEVLDAKTGEYRAQGSVKLESVKAAKESLAAFLSHPDAGGSFAREVWLKTLHYAASLIPEIADSIAPVDAAMETGYGWKMGPFALIDRIGVKAFVAMLREVGLDVPPLLVAADGRPLYTDEGTARMQMSLRGQYVPVEYPEGRLMLADVKRGKSPVFSDAGGALWDMGDGIACLEITTKLSSIDASVADTLEHALEEVGNNFKGLVIGNDAEIFSAGANLSLFLENAVAENYAPIGALIARGQQIMLKLQRAPFPVVASLAGKALGGGCELTLHAHRIQAHAEAQPGLVEANVGLVPAWGGCKEMLARNAPGKAFDFISTARTAASADDARQMGILRDHDGVSMNRTRLLAYAKSVCLAQAAVYAPAAPQRIATGNKDALLATLDERMHAGHLSAHDVVIGKVVAHILSGGGTGDVMAEEDLMALELEGFMELIRTTATQARIKHMLETGKPLKN